MHRVYNVFKNPEVVRLIDPMEMWKRKEILMRCTLQQHNQDVPQDSSAL